MKDVFKWAIVAFNWTNGYLENHNKLRLCCESYLILQKKGFAITHSLRIVWRVFWSGISWDEIRSIFWLLAVISSITAFPLDILFNFEGLHYDKPYDSLQKYEYPSRKMLHYLKKLLSYFPFYRSMQCIARVGKNLLWWINFVFNRTSPVSQR